MSGIEANRKRPLEGDEGQEGQVTNDKNGQEGNSNGDNGAENPQLKRVRLPNSGAQDNSTTTGSSAESLSSESRVQRQPPPPEQRQQPTTQSVLPYRPSRLDYAFFGMEVRDDVIQAIGDFLLQHCNRPNVE
ncbi:hypothetical protein BGZ76_009490, partial [Entomortierella beljakovae]